ncbi:hypothetical protein [Microcystis wesenbergii]|uniref:hypothetical protein n=1 Tax=Microcystis wesenbergii TaxID=44823 RepID=UPI0016810586|nr:hypothetical protein [Microcystis wesenbergii]
MSQPLYFFWVHLARVFILITFEPLCHPLRTQLQATNPTASEAELVRQVIRNNPTLKARLINAIKQGGTEALKVFFPVISIPIETIRGFLEVE